jgi:hypothetical protein
MPWPKGKPKHQNSGRKKGVQNRVTGLLKDAILRAAQIAGGDGRMGCSIIWCAKPMRIRPAI